MLNFERERSVIASSIIDQGRVEAFEQGRDGTMPYFPTTKATELSFKLGLDFRLKRLGIDDKISAEDVFDKGEFFASGFLTRLSILPPDGTGRIKTQDFVAIHNNSLQQSHLFNTADWESYVEGAIVAVQILISTSERETASMSRLPEFWDETTRSYTDFTKQRAYQANLAQEAEDLQNRLDGRTSEDEYRKRLLGNTKFLQEQRVLSEDIVPEDIKPIIFPKKTSPDA